MGLRCGDRHACTNFFLFLNHVFVSFRGNARATRGESARGRSQRDGAFGTGARRTGGRDGTRTRGAASAGRLWLFPLWEQTGTVEASGAARVGMRHAQVGVGPLTVGTDPYLDLYGTLNAGAKLGLLRRGRVRAALQTGYYRVPTAAETRGIGSLHASGFANPYAPVSLVPVAAGATFLALPQLHLHASATVLQTLSSEAESRTLTAGLSSWVEWWATRTRSVRLHAGVEGWPTGTQEHVGISFAWQTRYTALQAGYARRIASEGTSSNSIMFDGAVLFP